jgi:predicted TIM-barrel fold metal-dependent hydrolase
LNIPINLHLNEEVGHFYLGKSIIPLRHYYRLICRYPEMKLIMAHWGGGIFFYGFMPEVKRSLKNVYYDTAGYTTIQLEARSFSRPEVFSTPHSSSLITGRFSIAQIIH